MGRHCKSEYEKDKERTLPDDMTLCYACGCMTKCICGKCKSIKRTSKEA